MYMVREMCLGCRLWNDACNAEYVFGTYAANIGNLIQKLETG